MGDEPLSRAASQPASQPTSQVEQRSSTWRASFSIDALAFSGTTFRGLSRGATVSVLFDYLMTVQWEIIDDRTQKPAEKGAGRSAGSDSGESAWPIVCGSARCELLMIVAERFITKRRRHLFLRLSAGSACALALAMRRYLIPSARR